VVASFAFESTRSSACVCCQAAAIIVEVGGESVRQPFRYFLVGRQEQICLDQLLTNLDKAFGSTF
jgi:hypothetical protein